MNQDRLESSRTTILIGCSILVAIPTLAWLAWQLLTLLVQ